MIKIDHVAVWANDIETLKAFYENFFGAEANAKYTNEKKQFQSYFLTFSSGARLELMQRPGLKAREGINSDQNAIGYAHLAISVGSEMAVDKLTQRLVDGAYEHPNGHRRTGDGYYESVVLDPEGNRIEITA